MRPWFIFACLSLSFTIGCNLTDLDSGGGDSDGGPDGVATRAAYTTIKSWDGQVASLADGFRLIIVDGTGSVQRESCSWENTVPSDFTGAVNKGQLVFYRVGITSDFQPGEPMIPNEFIIVNLDCYANDPCTCGCPE